MTFNLKKSYLLPRIVIYWRVRESIRGKTVFRLEKFYRIWRRAIKLLESFSGEIIIFRDVRARMKSAMHRRIYYHYYYPGTLKVRNKMSVIFVSSSAGKWGKIPLASPSHRRFRTSQMEKRTEMPRDGKL